MSTFEADDFATIAKRQAEIAAQEERDRLEAERRATGWRCGDGHWMINDPAEARKTVDPDRVESWYETIYATQSPAPVEPDRVESWYETMCAARQIDPSGIRSLFDRAFMSARSNEFRKEPPTRKP